MDIRLKQKFAEDKPISIQSDLTILLDDRMEQADEVKERLAIWAELQSMAGHIHLYKITTLTLWNAVSMGENDKKLLQWLKEKSMNGLPLQAEGTIRGWISRFGKAVLFYHEQHLILAFDPSLLANHSFVELIDQWCVEQVTETRYIVNPENRGMIKQHFTRSGFPIIDQAGYIAGESLAVHLRTKTSSGEQLALRSYQQEAVGRWHHQTEWLCGSGVAVLPCGAGKTIIGIAALCLVGKATLILTSSETSVQQWKRELIDKTTIRETDIGIYSGLTREVRPITIATYHILTHRRHKTAAFEHMKLFTERQWGMIIYDEVHLLPAPVFRMTANIQATRRLGLTATLIREDGCAEDVYSLIGPKIYDMNWKKAESMQVIATVTCTEISIPLDPSMTSDYESATVRQRLRLAAENKRKEVVVQQLLHKHEDEPILIIGQYLEQLIEIAALIQAPIITGQVPQAKRDELFQQFKAGKIKRLVLSKVANLAVDLPDAQVAIQISGSFGSRQEEAQRIGRLLRPKRDNQAWFYTLVTDQSKEMEFALKRQLFMLEQGYHYERVHWDDQEQEVERK
ncbi:DNA repair helicase XPB [Paenibacillus yanchengensis]|uniref:DNA 3'-5' helicase n=1 Tax=Paenibacillus yanchengensis TaxID=2035833 RepID=A0ABW4YMP3_9BACL